MKTSNIIAGKEVQGSGTTFKGYNPAAQVEVDGDFEIATVENVEQAVAAAKMAAAAAQKQQQKH